MIYILLPAYNEEKNIGAVLTRLKEVQVLKEEPFHVVVVDDGSRDQTSEVVKKHKDSMAIELIRFEKNRGVGEVFNQGFRFICKTSPHPQEDICIALDSDNTQDPLLISALVHKIRENYDLVIASRFVKGGGMIGCPLWRGLLSLAASWTLRLTIALPGIKDYSTFYRAYRVSLIQQGFQQYGSHLLDGKGFAAVAGLLVRLGNLTQRLAEIPLLLRYDLKKGKSGMRLFLTIRGYLALAWQQMKIRCSCQSEISGDQHRSP